MRGCAAASMIVDSCWMTTTMMYVRLVLPEKVEVEGGEEEEQ